MLCDPAWWRGAEHTLGRPRERATGVHQHFHGPRGPERERVHLVTEGSPTAMSPAGSASVSHYRHSRGARERDVQDAQVSDAHHPGDEIVRSTCGNRVRPDHEPDHGSWKILEHAADLGKRAALGSRTPDLRITRDVITAYTMLAQSIRARRAVHRAQRERL
jgi:hypothetical protein